jgi:hypothetical protein
MRMETALHDISTDSIQSHSDDELGLIARMQDAAKDALGDGPTEFDRMRDAMQAKDARIAEVENLAMVLEAERGEIAALYEKQGVGAFKLVKEAQSRAERAEAALAAMTAERDEAKRVLGIIGVEAETANNVIRQGRSKDGQGHTKLATALHRIAIQARAFLAKERQQEGRDDAT